MSSDQRLTTVDEAVLQGMRELQEENKRLSNEVTTLNGIMTKIDNHLYGLALGIDIIITQLQEKDK